MVTAYFDYEFFDEFEARIAPNKLPPGAACDDPFLCDSLYIT